MTATIPKKLSKPRKAYETHRKSEDFQTGRQAKWKHSVAADSVAVFRIGFGLLVAFSSLRFLWKGWVDTLYLAPENHLAYRWFGWVAPLSAPWMHLVVLSLAGLGVCIALGYRHRLATTLFIVGFGYTELIEASLYLNHYWFITLAAVLLLLLPAHRHWSLDAATGRIAGRATGRIAAFSGNTQERAGRAASCAHVEAWVVWALRAQVGIVYLFAGLAKLNGDWLFHAQPLRLWLADRTHLPVIGPILDEPLVAYAASWGSAAFDCTIVAWLLWRRSRPWAYAVLVIFHIATWLLFPKIGVFPWVMIFCALIFFPPDWPRKLTERAKTWLEEVAGVGRTAVDSESDEVRLISKTARVGRGAIVFLAIFAALQIFLPLRHYLEPGNVRWNEQGYYLSWRVMLTEKAGALEFEVADPATGRSWLVYPELVLTDWQATHAATRPDLIHATALLIADRYQQKGIADVEVRAKSWVSMNGREAKQFIDPTVNLAAHPRGKIPHGWILSENS